MTEEARSRTAEKFVIRFPEGMREKIAQAAEAAGRSMNAEIVYQLERSLEVDKNEAFEYLHLALQAKDRATKRLDKFNADISAFKAGDTSALSWIRGGSATVSDAEVLSQTERIRDMLESEIELLSAGIPVLVKATIEGGPLPKGCVALLGRLRS